MLVCHCCVVYERRIRDEIARGARSEGEIARACGAGTGCGGCVPLIMQLLGECADCPARVEPASTVAIDPAADQPAIHEPASTTADDPAQADIGGIAATF